MKPDEIKIQIRDAIKAFNSGDLTKNSMHLFQTLDYNTERSAHLAKPDFNNFKESYLTYNSIFNEAKALVSEWKYVDLLFQLSKSEILKQTSLFDVKKVDNTLIETYLFFVIELNGDHYTRGNLSSITREVNKVFPMPVMILFRHNNSLTLSVINRRLHKRDESKDVLEKVTLIKDINIEQPHRAHIEILFDLSFEQLKSKHNVTNFVELQEAWQKTLDIKELNKQFYEKLFNWYLWALKIPVNFPQIRAAEDMLDNKTHQSESLIRLLTRLLFVWFMKEKGLVNQDLFDLNRLKSILKNFDGANGSETIYYKAILQNLFFATLNKPISERKVIDKGFNPKEYGDPLVYRYDELFNEPKNILKHFENTPFLNGGLFECLDQKKDKDNPTEIRLDGFTTKKNKQPFVPDKLFFGEYKNIDLSKAYDDKKKNKTTVYGLIDILNQYKFTIEENTPIEEEIALDPELLGKVFENLLASYNPETQTNARNQTGSFYTPREIVNYMVEESLIAYLKNYINDESNLRKLFSYEAVDSENPFNETDTSILVKAIDNCKILDPACGSGAFPMGVLHKLIFILHKLDPTNKLWFNMVVENVPAYMRDEFRKRLKKETWNYVRKLGIIQQCIYGVDIQPIATQIAKLRFFISLLVDQTDRPEEVNRGFEPLPNLDFKIVTANTLISPPSSDVKSEGLFENQTDPFFIEFDKLTELYFNTSNEAEKKELRTKITQLINNKCNEKIVEIQSSYDSSDERVTKALKEKKKRVIASKENDINLWKSYTNLFKHESVGFFEPRYFFPKVKGGFDIVIGNPPYISTRTKDFNKSLKNYYEKNYSLSIGQYDLFILFIEKSNYLMNSKGILTFIVPKRLLTNENFEKARQFILNKLPIYNYVDTQMPFESANVEANVIFSSRDSIEKIKTHYFNGNKIIFKDYIDKKDIVNMPFTIFPFAINHKNVAIINSVLKKCVFKFGDYLTIIRGMECGFNHPSISTSKSKYKIVKGEHISKYVILETNWYVNPDFSDKKVFKSKEIYLNVPKILTKFVSNTLDFALDTVGYYNTNVIYNIHPKSEYRRLIKYFLALGNSKLVNFWFFNTYINDDKVFPHIQKNQLESIPVIIPKDISTFEDLVDKILSAKQQNPQADTKHFEDQIDIMVYKLYELTYEEVEIIDSQIGKIISKADYDKFRIQ